MHSQKLTSEIAVEKNKFNKKLLYTKVSFTKKIQYKLHPLYKKKEQTATTLLQFGGLLEFLSSVLVSC